MRLITNGLLALCALAAAFSLYAAFSFWALEDISTPAQIPRVRYDRNFWLVLFVASAIALVALSVYRTRIPPRD